ncbi:hypothetical protein JKG68_12045 [Microvirga aerilata]|uniref:Uncharacterized protein n=1 Tax=Microvirga aerilata TaxID=670292 RepID=A0A937CZH1_9HYPH|nr:hypothetical protein [Microvirga aerilata]MBL0404701.1 hypothetical protein [Microvirga aerilata]
MIDVPTLLLSDVAKAARIDLGILRQWVNRGAFPLGPKDKAEGIRLVTRRTAFALTVAARLVEHAIPISRAANAAAVASEDFDEGEGEPFLILYTPPADLRKDETAIRFGVCFGEEALIQALTGESDDHVKTVVRFSRIISAFKDEEATATSDGRPLETSSPEY